MLSSLRVEGFRRFDELTLDGLGQINFLLGDNNVGKTSILEAVYAWACGVRIPPLLGVPLSRARYYGFQNPYWLMEEVLATVHDRSKPPFAMIFEGMDDGHVVRFEHTIVPSDILGEYDTSYKASEKKAVGTDDNSIMAGDPLSYVAPSYTSQNATLVAKWRINGKDSAAEFDITTPSTQVSYEPPYRNAKFIDLLSHTGVSDSVNMYASLKRGGLLSEVAKEIEKVFFDIDGFDMIPYPDGSQAPLSVVKKDGTLLPLYAYGDGVQRWFYVLGVLSSYKNSIVCIDEVDVGLHPQAQEEFSVSLVENALRNDVQVFATTHNIEFIDKLLDALSNSKSDVGSSVRILTLREFDGEIRVRNLSADEACKARSSYNLELR